MIALQFRSMHTAVHQLALLHDLEGAQSLLAHINEHEELPEVPPPGFLDIIPIDHRCPPQAIGTVPLQYINPTYQLRRTAFCDDSADPGVRVERYVPDVWGF